MHTENKILNEGKAMLLISDGLIQDKVAFGFMFLNFDKYGNYHNALFFVYIFFKFMQ